MKELSNAVDMHRELILEAERYIWKHPETGYREVKTSKYLEEKFEALGYDLIKAGNIPGFYTVIDTGRPGPEVLILGEMDSLIVPNHKEADKETGYVHSCGHNVQVAALLGLAAALKEPGVLDKFCGRIRLCAVPAEELIEIEFRKDLRRQGVIKYLGGKTEFLYRGYFDGVDLAFMVHASPMFRVQYGSVGCIAKNAYYKGVSSHAGGSPWNGKNALYAASQGLSAANAIRETFKEADLIRFHPIITHGGAVVNAIPELTVLEAFVRGKTYDAINGANEKINRALCGAALSIGTNVEIQDCAGYGPLVNDMNMVKLSIDAAALAIPEEEYTVNPVIGTGSTDMGDLSGIMPVVHPYSGGTVGRSHGDDYYVVDPERACVKSVKLQLAMLLLLLQDDAKRAKKILAEFKPTYPSKEAYFEVIDKIFCEGDRITYREDGTAEVKL